jgi:hypothetical protein
MIWTSPSRHRSGSLGFNHFVGFMETAASVFSSGALPVLSGGTISIDHSIDVQTRQTEGYWCEYL